MDLASGYSDSINYGNGYTPLATGAINNNNAAYAQQQAAMAAYAQAMQNNVFASGGGFGQQTADYAGAGAAYGRATGGFNGSAPGWADPQPQPQANTATMFDGMSPADMATWQQTMYNAGRGSEIPQGWGSAPNNPSSQQLLGYDPNNPFVGMSGTGGGIGSDAARSPAQYQNQNPVVDWQQWATQLTAPGGISNQQANPWATSPGYDYNNPASYSGLPAGGFQPMNNPSSQQLLGYDPTQQMFRGMSAGDMNTWRQAMMAAGRGDEISDTQTPAQYGGPDTNLYGYPSSGSLGTGTPFGGYQPDTPLGQGGVGSDTSRDRMAWMLAQQSPWATPGAPANGPYPNLGYNPAMSNYFANPTMQQYDWTANNAKLQQQMQDALRTIDQSTGRQPEQPYGGQLPSFWQGVRDWTGMGDPQPTPTRDTWTNAS